MKLMTAMSKTKQKSKDGFSIYKCRTRDQDENVVEIACNELSN